MGLYHLIYQSQAVVPFADAELAALLLWSRAYNRQIHVTGLLLHAPDGRFLQILEGEDADVRQLYYQNILSDPRHYQCQVLGEGSCAERSFADWSMGCRVAQADDLHKLLHSGALNAPTRHGPRPTIRPELMELLLEFVEAKAAQ
ncbi:BLUF domain-containing protein [Hymenobacter sp.]|uniref:BLUF domain-containing protein n=1 Tax=Hymenobacter sp. TaxID=1898978 RepID=UPI00286D0CC3|nr:BLUF domain-containing protein [Hymenobacter sp.]